MSTLSSTSSRTDSRTDSRTESPGPDATLFAGLRILELGGGMAAPMAGMIFADHGADVVKVEPPTGELTRGRPEFLMWNRGKKSLALDLAVAPDRARFSTLLRGCDAIITALRPESLQRLGADWPTINRLNPAAIHCEITGWGRLTRFAHLKAYEGVVAAACGRMMGLDTLSGAAADHPADIPAFTYAPVASFGAASLAVQGIVAGLIAGRSDGGGDHLLLSLAESATVAMMRFSFRRETSPKINEQRAAMSQGIRLTFLGAQCSDGKWIQMCARQDDHFARWLQALGLGYLLDDPRYANGPLRIPSVDDIKAVEQIIRARMLERSQAEWMELFANEYDVGGDPYLTPEEFLEHPQMIQNDRVVVIEDPLVGPVTQVGPLVLMSETPAVIDRPAPALGAHKDMMDWAPRPETAVPDAATPAAQPGTGPCGPAPLSGITVVELGPFVAGPAGGVLLAELGARVIKIEPPEGDSYRRVGLESAHLMHGKESVVLDLKRPEGRQALHRILEHADAVFHNFRPGVAERLAFDYETVRSINPTIVYVTAASYGTRGPQAGRTAFHSTPNALCGGGILQAGEGNPPVDDSYPDPCAGTTVATAVILGLYHRARRGIGQHVETSMLASAGYVHSHALVHYEGSPRWRPSDQEQHGPSALYRLYRCRDGWIFLAVLTDAEWEELCRVLGLRHFVEDDRLSSAASRLEHDGEIAKTLQEVMVREPADHWVSLLATRGVGVAPADDQRFEETLISSGSLQEAEIPGLGKYWKFQPRFRYERLRTSVGSPCALGEHTVSVLESLGLSAEVLDMNTAR